jgi:hypothetical protein
MGERREFSELIRDIRFFAQFAFCSYEIGALPKTVKLAYNTGRLTKVHDRCAFPLPAHLRC